MTLVIVFGEELESLPLIPPFIPAPLSASVFILCWTPYFLWDLLQVYGYIPLTQNTIAISTFIQSMAPLNSAANPLIYYLFTTHFCRTIP